MNRPPLQMPDCWSATQIGARDDAGAPADSSPAGQAVVPLERASPEESSDAARQSMTSGARLAWPHLRSALQRALCPVRVARKRPIDWLGLARRVAQARPLLPLPQRRLQRWPANLVLALDRDSPTLTPFVDDMDLLANRLRRIAGHRAVEVRVLATDPAARYASWSETEIKPSSGRWQSLYGDPLVLVSDCALGDAGRKAAFEAWLRRMAHGGSEITVLGIGPAARAALPATIGLQPWYADSVADARVAARELDDLLSLIAAVGSVSDGLLRALAQIIRPGKPPLDLIWAAWNHADVVLGGRHCWLRPEASPRFERRLAAMDLDRLLAAAEQIRLLRAQVDAATYHLSALRMSHLAPQSLQDPRCAQAIADAEYFLNSTLAEKWNSGDIETQAQMARTVRRIIHLAHPRVQTVYRRSFVRLARMIGREGSGLSAQVSDEQAPVEWTLIRAGSALRLLRGDPPWAGAVLARNLVAAPGSAISLHDGDTPIWKLLDAEQVELADLSAAGAKLRLEFDNCRVLLERHARPSWASAWGHTRSGLRAQIWSPWGSEVWLPWPCGSDVSAVDEDGRGGSFGVDEFGLYFDLVLEGATQRFRWIEPGEFLMGSPDDEPGHDDDEGPQHRVRISEGFWLADSACTQALWLAVMGDNPSRFDDDPQNPVERVSWQDVQVFLGRLRERLPAGSDPVLPSEAQWEYACRADTRTPFNLVESISPEHVNYSGNYPYEGAAEGEYRARTVPVKSLPPNGWGLYEMHGNVWEWCADGLRDYSDVGSGEVVVDPVGPVGPTESASSAVRGGSWIIGARYARSADRSAGGLGERHDFLGFRLALRSGSPERPEGAPRSGGPEARKGTLAPEAPAPRRDAAMAADPGRPTGRGRKRR